MKRMILLGSALLAVTAISWACRSFGKAVESVGDATGVKAVSDLGKVIQSGEELSPSEQYYVGRSVSANILVRYKVEEKKKELDHYTQLVGEVKDVAVPPRHGRAWEALLGPLQYRCVGVHSDDSWNALRQTSSQKTVATANFEHRRRCRWHAPVEFAVVMDVDVPPICHELSLNACHSRRV